MTKNQAVYHAQRAHEAEYTRKMNDPRGPGNVRLRQDGAITAAAMAYEHKLRQHGLTEEAGR